MATAFAQSAETPDSVPVPLTLSTPTPTNPLEHNNRAVELGTRGLWDSAIREHEIAIAGDPDNEIFRRNLSGAHLRYADILASKKLYRDAIEHYTLALYADQNNGPADSNRDATLRRIGKNPSSVKYWHGVAEKAMKAEDLRIAVPALRKCTKLSDNPSYNLELGRILLENRPSQAARDELLKAAAKYASKGDKEGEQECKDLIKKYGLRAPYQWEGDKNKFLWDDRR
ncbi:MAG: hypothetical protein SFV17_24445 [Candidatus Obscuribacter sp.]|nr:hypothetical protein [Candidatus Obscuribacter sp.]